MDPSLPKPGSSLPVAFASVLPEGSTVDGLQEVELTPAEADGNQTAILGAPSDDLNASGTTVEDPPNRVRHSPGWRRLQALTIILLATTALALLVPRSCFESSSGSGKDSARTTSGGEDDSNPENADGVTVIKDTSVNYLYAPADTAKAVNGIGRGDFTMSVHLLGQEDCGQAVHPMVLSNRGSQQRDWFLFGVHAQWRRTQNKIPYMQIGGISWVVSHTGILDGQWHHFVARRRGETLSYFVDGAHVVDLTTDILGSAIGSARNVNEKNLVIGYDLINPSATRFVGELKELSVWNVSLPGASIATGLDSLKGIEDGLIAYFPVIPLDETGELVDHTLRT